VSGSLRRAVFGTVFLGVGALTLVFAIGLRLVVVPEVSKLSYATRACATSPAAEPSGCLAPSVAEAPGATYLAVQPDLAVSRGTLRATVRVVPQSKISADEQAAGRLDGNAIVWSVSTTVVRADADSVVSQSTTQLALDRTTGAAVAWDGQWIDNTGSVDRSIVYSDQTYMFPFGTSRQDYRIYDAQVRAATPATYVESTEIDGVAVYHFTQTVPDTAVAVSADRLGLLLDRFAPRATSGTLYYRTIRDVWVEPTTGAFIKVRVHPHQELRPDVGAAVTLLDADFTDTDDTVRANVAYARANLLRLDIVSRYAPVGLGVLAALLLVGGFLLVRPRPALPDQIPLPRETGRPTVPVASART
jgi:hypothetical protein